MISDRYTWILADTIGLYTAQLYPGWGYSENDNKSKTFSRTYGGQLNVFTKVGSFQEYFFPLDYVSSINAHTMNGWWDTQLDLYLTINSSVDASITAETISNIPVRIANTIRPFNQNVPNRFTDFQGSLILVTR